MNSESSGRLEEQVRALTERLWRLEMAVQHHGIELEPEPFVSAQEVPAPPPTAATPPLPPRPDPGIPLPISEKRTAPPPTAAAPRFSLMEQGSVPDTVSLETRIGSQWFNRLGILALLIGVAWFLKMAFDNHWIGALGRVLIGLLAGAALIGWSERFRSRGFAAFSYSLKAVGSGSLYLSLWAAFSLYSLIPASAAFVAMIAVTGFNGFMSWMQDAELLALYAIAGGLGTPLLVSTGGNHEITLFIYLLMLDCSVLMLVALRPWSRLLFASFTGTVLFVSGWWFRFYSYEQAGRTAFFLICFFLLFAFAPRLIRIKITDEGEASAWDQLVLVPMPLFNAGLGFLAFYFLLDGRTYDWAGPWIAVAFAAFYLLVNRLPGRGALQSSSPLLSSLHLSAAVVFLTLAVPLKTQGRWLTVGWLVEGGMLIWLAVRLRSSLLHALGLICLCLGLGAVLVINPDASLTPFFNQRFATYAVAIAVFAIVARVALRSPDQPDVAAIRRWPALAAASILVINGLILLAVGWEIHSFWWYLSWRGDWQLMHDYHMYAQFTYSAFFMLFGAALLSLGFWRRSAFLRWQALLLLAISIGKVFVVDVSELSRGFRILSFLGLGALLLAVSYVYQRDWLNLRAQGNQNQ
jgi:uncharacterized membrane protein